MFVKMIDNSLFYVFSCRISHWEIVPQTQKVYIEFDDPEWAERFKRNVQHCNEFGRGCNLVLQNADNTRYGLVHDCDFNREIVHNDSQRAIILEFERTSTINAPCPNNHINELISQMVHTEPYLGEISHPTQNSMDIVSPKVDDITFTFRNILDNLVGEL